MLRASVYFIALLVFASVATAGENVDDIINKYFDARGGKENIENIKSIKLKADFTANGKATKLTYYSEGNDKFSFEKEKDGIIEISATNGKNGWTSTDGVITNSKPTIRKLIESSIFLLIRGPFLLDSNEVVLEFSDGSKAMEDGHESYKINMSEANKSKSDSVYSYIDAADFLLYKITDNSNAASGHNMLLMFNDYKKHDGIFFPTELVLVFNSKISVLTITELKINKDIDDSIFEKPEE